MNRVALVVPCFNEADRWLDDYWAALLEAGLSLIFVDDGSTDSTRQRIAASSDHDQASSVTLALNRGKGEAVRAGLLHALDSGADVVGFLDADGAFPQEEVVRLAEMSERLLLTSSPDYEAVWSARVQLAGRSISRHASRHYLGRAVATAIAPWHGHDLYDTQSGYKLLRANEVLSATLQQPFDTRWFFDVEILQRWRQITGEAMPIWEEPVMGWQDVRGSKVNKTQGVQLMKDALALRRGRMARRS